jgi:hypothetical protein
LGVSARPSVGARIAAAIVARNSDGTRSITPSLGIFFL